MMVIRVINHRVIVIISATNEPPAGLLIDTYSMSTLSLSFSFILAFLSFFPPPLFFSFSSPHFSISHPRFSLSLSSPFFPFLPLISLFLILAFLFSSLSLSSPFFFYFLSFLSFFPSILSLSPSLLSLFCISVDWWSI